MQTQETWVGLARLMRDDFQNAPSDGPMPQAVSESEEMELAPGMEYCPTPEQIRAECRKIQTEWSERERWRRAGFTTGRGPRWTPPQATAPAFDHQDLAWAV